ncbi:MAG TPA: 16S rRNA (guanine(966)-N(2))-methyltransferase RsmD [Rhabdochlamydiaceae bacterium]|jgi:16S rRNA (guanine966-N2)-methyltransferase|nr:16S rRNA (guanine(966)-N(2))-methyltransferase RsmD [Rhabdochlamydiaceae bacterium]
MSLRVLGGKYRSLLLRSPRGAQTRPTTSMLRKAVFDMIQSTIEGSRFLDLFAGSGAIGIEALSRGATQATFVESHKEALRCIKANLAALKIEKEAAVYSYDVLTVLKKLEKKGDHFNFIYADPPYHLLAIYDELLAYLDNSQLLSKGGTLFLESRAPLKNRKTDHLVLIDQRRFGTSLLHRYQL